MGWSLEYSTDQGSTWNTWPEATYDKTAEELNGHEECNITVPDDPTNRTRVASDIDVRIKFDTTVIFRGILTGVKYLGDVLSCTIYNKCFEKLKKKDYTNDFPGVAANIILDGICTAVTGTASANGAVDGSTVIDTTRTEADGYFIGMALKITSGACSGQTRRITDWVKSTGTFTVTPAFSAQIVSGVTYTVYFVVPGTCPSDAKTVRFKKAIRMDCVDYLASSLRKDVYGDYDAYENPRINIADRGSYKGALSTLSVSPRTVDRGKEKNFVVARGKDIDGIDIYGKAYYDYGTQTIVQGSDPPSGYDAKTFVFSSSKGYDTTTLNGVAADKLYELRRTTMDSTVKVSIVDGYNIFPGDTVTINDARYGYNNETLRVWKPTKYLDSVELTVDTPENILEKMFEDLQGLEDLGIYLPTTIPASISAGTSFPASAPIGEAFYRTDLNILYRCTQTVCTLEEHWTPIVQVTGSGATSFPAGKLGDLFYRTDQGKMYRCGQTTCTLAEHWLVVTNVSSSGLYTNRPASGSIIGEWYYATDTKELFRWNGSTWDKTLQKVQVVANVSDLAGLANKAVGDTCYVTNAMQTFYYTGTVWIPLATIAHQGTTTERLAFSTAGNAAIGDIWFDTTESVFYRWNGSSWTVLWDILKGTTFPAEPKEGQLFQLIKTYSVPEAYYDFIYHYAPYAFVLKTNITSDALVGQKDVVVADGTKFLVGYPVEIKDNVNSEWNEVASINGNTLTMVNNLAHTYYVAQNARVDHPDKNYGKNAFSASYAIECLCEAYSKSQFSARQTEIYNKIVSLSDWLLTQQCTDPVKEAYGGFMSAEGSTYYYSVDASRAIPALLAAYSLTNTVSYRSAAILAGYIYLYNMQHRPFTLGLHDKYYGGFAEAVTINDVWVLWLRVHELYGLVALEKLKTYDPTHAATYTTMEADLAACLRPGLEAFWLQYKPLPYGDNQWHRTGSYDELVWDDDFSYSLYGLYIYEGKSSTIERVYNFLASIGTCTTYPFFSSSIFWPGYYDVKTRAPGCAYYDVITTGILLPIRLEYDKDALKRSVEIINGNPLTFLYWGVLFTDYSPVADQRAMSTVSWLFRMFLDYIENVLYRYNDSIGNWEIIDTVVTSERTSTGSISHFLAGKVIFTSPGTLQDWGTTESGVTVIDGGKIQTDSVKTKQLQFDRLLTAQEPTGEGKLFYNTEVDQLRFIGAAGEKGYIPRFPITEYNKPPENLLLNPEFEEDVDNDGVPDFWTKEGSVTLTDVDSYRGKRCVRLDASIGGYSRLKSSYIPVAGSAKYFVSAATKCQYADNADILIQIYWYDKTKAFVSISTVYDGGGATDWAKKFNTVTSPNTARYAVVYLQNYTPTAACYVLFDDTVFSELRAAVPTEGVVASAYQLSGSWISIPADGNFHGLSNIVVPSTYDLELLMIAGNIQRLSHGTEIFATIRFVCDGIYYPDPSGTLGVDIASGCASGGYSPMATFFGITIPKNVKGKVLYLEVKVPTGFADDYVGALSIWGHIPHTHR